MTKEELLTCGDLKKTLDNKQGFIVIHMPKKPTEKRTMIHYSSCNNLEKHFEIRYGVSDDKKLGKSNKQKYYHYDSFNAIMSDYPKAKPCSKCNPTSPLT